MKRRKKTAEEEGCFDLVERAFQLVRRASFSVIALYYLGAVPFVLGLLFFLADMSASPFAIERCVGSSFGLGLLYIWMRVWQALYCRRLGGILTHQKSESLTVRQILRQVGLHTVYSSWGLILVPLSALMALPFGWVFAYFNNLCVVDAITVAPKEAATKARAMAMPWPKQNHLAIGLLLFFGYFVFLNIVSVLAQLPGLLKSLVGIENTFSQSYHWILNTTFLGVAAGLSYLVVDPLVKAVYVLRFHAAESITTGADLLAELKSFPPRRRSAGMVRAGLVVLLLLSTPMAFAQEGDGSTVPAIEEAALDAAVDDVMKRSEFTWRMPRDFAPEEGEEKGFFARFIDSVFQWLEDSAQACGDAIDRFFDWLSDRDHTAEPRDRSSIGFSPSLFKGLSLILLVVLVVVLLWYLLKMFQARRTPPPNMEEARPVVVSVDLEDENLIATLLEEDEWIALARELAASGELRKAMRAWFLAGLAFLARTDLLVILHSKSNLEYRRELDRRARRCPSVIPAFGENIKIFEHAWYGLHNATAEDLGQLEQNMERMRHGVEA